MLWLLARTSVGLVYQCCLAVVAVVVIVLVVGVVFVFDGPVVLVLVCICDPIAADKHRKLALVEIHLTEVAAGMSV